MKRKNLEDGGDATAVTNGDSAKDSKKRRRLSEDKSKAKFGKDRKSKKEKRKQPLMPETEELSIEAADEATPKRKRDDDQGESAGGDDAPTPSKKAKKEKKEKKDKKDKKDKKEKKDKKNKTKKPDPAAEETKDAAGATEEGDEETAEGGAGGNEPKNHRFIVFVGNLPYSATVPQITEHFASVSPISVRLLHNKLDPSKSRGVAFVEFAGYDHMKTALKTLHHSTFRCPVAEGGAGKMEERKINVELTAGGGGNTSNRREKIKAKNVKLNEERARRAAEENKAKKEKQKGKGEDVGAGVHPSRRFQVPGSE